jgi:hypothetical protein
MMYTETKRPQDNIEVMRDIGENTSVQPVGYALSPAYAERTH